MTVRIKKEGYIVQDDNQEVDFIWSVFLEPCSIEAGVTVGDIFALVSRYNELEGLVSRWFPRYRSETMAELETDRIELYRVGNKCKNHMSIRCEANVNPVLSQSGLPVVCFDSFTVYEKSTRLFDGKCSFTFIEVIQTFFDTYQYVHDLILESDNDYIWDDAERVYQEPLDCLFLECRIHELFTLFDLFRIVESSQLLKNLVASFGLCDVDQIHNQTDKTNSKIESLYVSRNFEDNRLVLIGLDNRGKPYPVNLQKQKLGHCSLTLSGSTMAGKPFSTDFTFLDVLRAVYATNPKKVRKKIKA